MTSEYFSRPTQWEPFFPLPPLTIASVILIAFNYTSARNDRSGNLPYPDRERGQARETPYQIERSVRLRPGDEYRAARTKTLFDLNDVVANGGKTARDERTSRERGIGLGQAEGDRAANKERSFPAR